MKKVCNKLGKDFSESIVNSANLSTGPGTQNKCLDSEFVQKHLFLGFVCLFVYLFLVTDFVIGGSWDCRLKKDKWNLLTPREHTTIFVDDFNTVVYLY